MLSWQLSASQNHKTSVWWICLFYLQVLKKMTWETTSAKSVHKFSCRYLIYMSTEQEREYTLTVMHVTEFTTQQRTRCKDVWFSCSPWFSGCSFSQGKVGWSHWSPDKLNRTDQGKTEEDPWLLWYTLQKMFNMISHGKLLQQVRTHQNFWVMALKSILTKHQGKIQHISPDGLEKGGNIEKINPSWRVRKKTFYERKLKVKCIKA